MTGKILSKLIVGIVILLFMQAPAFAKRPGGHKNGRPTRASQNYEHAKRHNKHGKHHHKNDHGNHYGHAKHKGHGNHYGHAKHEGHDHHYADGRSGVNVNLPADPITLKPEVCIRGLCLSTK